MSLRLTALLLTGLLAVSACTNPDRFNSAGGAAGAAGGAGIDSSSLDPASNPSSPQYFAQTIGDRVLFEVDSSTISVEGRQTLDGQAAWLLTNTDYLAVVEGHADEQGTREYNIALGARRASAVRDYLVSKGVPAGRLRTVSYGKERPISICSEESCYRQNRRAVTIISVGQVS